MSRVKDTKDGDVVGRYSLKNPSRSYKLPGVAIPKPTLDLVGVVKFCLEGGGPDFNEALLERAVLLWRSNLRGERLSSSMTVLWNAGDFFVGERVSFPSSQMGMEFPLLLHGVFFAPGDGCVDNDLRLLSGSPPSR